MFDFCFLIFFKRICSIFFIENQGGSICFLKQCWNSMQRK